MSVRIVVLVDPAVAEQLVVLGLRSWVQDRARTLGVAPSAALRELVADVEQLGTAYRRGRSRTDGVVTDVVTPCRGGDNTAHTEPVELTVSEAADRLGKTRQAIDGRIRRGTLTARTDELGRRLVRVEDL